MKVDTGLQSAGGEGATARFVAPAALLVFAVHGLVLLAGPEAAAPGTFVFLIGTPVMAGILCMLRAKRDGWEGWLPLAAAMLLWAAGMAATVLGLMALEVESELSLSMLLYVLYGVPIIFALTSPAEEAWYVRVVDALLAAALGYVFFRYVSIMSTMTGTAVAGSVALRLMFDIENIYILLFAAIRLAACTDAAQRRFLRVLTVYAGLYMLVAAYINHVESDTEFGHWPDLLVDLPFLFLALAAAGSPRFPVPAVSRRFALVVKAGSPLMIPVTLLTVSALLVSHDVPLVLTGAFFATAGYGVRSVLVQLRSYDEQDRLTHLSHNDALTGVANRRLFDEVLQREVLRAQRDRTPLALLMIDIDHFKLLNDHLGHPVGDVRLRSVASALQACARSGSDLVARYGGEEFAVILPRTEVSQSVPLAERMRGAVEDMHLASPAPSGRVTVSIGLAQLMPGSADAQALIDGADRALYEAKRGGRNRVGREMERVLEAV
jgi:diguanylate cyclase (GGDEF)-like protein